MLLNAITACSHCNIKNRPFVVDSIARHGRSTGAAAGLQPFVDVSGGATMARGVFCLRRWTGAACLLFLCGIGAANALPAAPASVTAEDRGKQEAVRTGTSLERSHRWLDAIEHYEDALEEWPGCRDLKYGLRRSKIHFGIQRRYADKSFRERLQPQSRPEALDLFDEILHKVRTDYVEPVSSTSFVAHGTESLYLALSNDEFLERNLPHASERQIRDMRTILRDRFWNKPVSHRLHARRTVEQVCDIARDRLGLQGGTVVMEYIFGGCNALDDYSNYLTPGRLDDLYANIEGEFVGLGIEMKGEMGKGMLLVNVLPDSPAAEGGLLPGDYIVGIDGTDCRKMTTDAAASLLRGPSGSRVHLEFRRPLDDETLERSFTRRSVEVKSIPEARIVDERSGIGYIRMTGFQRTSPTEMDAALQKLDRQGMRALIWDLRGNPGGLLTAAVEVADRFIEEGLLVSTRGRSSDQNWRYSAHRPGTWNIPLVLLVDHGSASASEIVAGAIRDHNRGLIVGRTTYGKWSVQTILPVRDKTGLRLTTARFYSPSGKTLSKVGVEPDEPVELPDKRVTLYRGIAHNDLDEDVDLQKGLEILRRQLTR